MAGILTGYCLICSLLANPPLQRFESQQAQLGTIIKITVYCDDEALARKAIQSAFKRIEKLNLILSDYDSNSELRRLCNNATPEKPMKVSADLLKVLVAAQSVSKQSNGAFDVTVGPVVKLWRRTRRRKRLPDKQRLKAALAKIGYQHMKIDSCAKSVLLKKQGMLLDLGGIAKGYIADEALKELKRFGINRALVDAGGDIVAGDPPPDQTGWRIGIEKRNDRRQLGLLLSINNAAVATSGDTYQFVEIDGIRYSHIVDPHTGVGLTTPLSVTIIAPNGMTADAWASAVSVLGLQKGLSLIEKQQGLAGSVSQLGANNSIQQTQSKSFHKYIIVSTQKNKHKSSQ